MPWYVIVSGASLTYNILHITKYTLALSVALLILFPGCARTELQVDSDGTHTYTDSNNPVLKKHDIIRILMSDDNRSFLLKTDEHGFIDFPYAGKVQVVGLKLSEIDIKVDRIFLERHFDLALYPEIIKVEFHDKKAPFTGDTRL